MRGQPKFATVGMFDGVHRGHRSLIGGLKYEASRRGMSAAVFTFDRHPLSLISPDKAPASLMCVQDKIRAIRRAGADFVEVLDFDGDLRSLSAAQFITLLRDRYGVKALMMGFNHRFGSDRLPDISDYEKIGRDLGIEIVRAGELRDHTRHEPICSSSIRRALVSGDILSANDMLGYPYRLKGSVVAGKRLGRTIGFPTANIDTGDSNLLIPGSGVYAVDVILPDGKVSRGMLNIGRRPTVDHSAEAPLSVEVHVIGWNGDLYRKEIAVMFLDRIRDERCFTDLDALKKQLSTDCQAAIVAC